MVIGRRPTFEGHLFNSGSYQPLNIIAHMPTGCWWFIGGIQYNRKAGGNLCHQETEWNTQMNHILAKIYRVSMFLQHQRIHLGLQGKRRE